jgi:hypothetical protein
MERLGEAHRDQPVRRLCRANLDDDGRRLVVTIKGDLPMVIDPTTYKIAVSLAEAEVQPAQVNALNAESEAKRRQELPMLE